MPLAAHGVTHTGRRRINEDSMLLDPSLGLFVVADGMGGHNAGEVASAIAVRTLHDFTRTAAAASEATLLEAFSLANEEVFHTASTEPDYEGMGTTVVAALVDDDRLLFGSVGDSRIYLWRRGTLTQLTRDDSWVSRVLPAEVMSAEEAQRHPMRHVLTKVVGLREEVDPTIGACEFLGGDVLVMCSDGLHGAMTHEQIAHAVASGLSVTAIAEHLVEQALAGGATDNVTVVVLRQE
jgi:serine/threonine protein phosphatase PrpC